MQMPVLMNLSAVMSITTLTDTQRLQENECTLEGKAR
jgi:hypothetical protein